MKKKILNVLLIGLLLCGCTRNSKDNLNQAGIETYETYYTEVISNGHYTETSQYFTLSYEMIRVEDGSYRYYIILDDPKIAMYNVMMIAVENGVSYQECETMVPSFGIFEDRVSLVPGQVNYEEAYVKGISISGQSDKDTMDLLILVRWKSSDGTQMSAYIQHTVSIEE